MLVTLLFFPFFGTEPHNYIDLNGLQDGWRRSSMTVNHGVAYFLSFDGQRVYALNLSEEKPKPEVIFKASSKESPLSILGKTGMGVFILDTSTKLSRESLTDGTNLYVANWHPSTRALLEIKTDSIPLSLFERNGKICFSTRWPEENLTFLFETDASFETRSGLSHASRELMATSLDSGDYNARNFGSTPQFKVKGFDKDKLLAYDKIMGKIVVLNHAGNVEHFFEGTDLFKTQKGPLFSLKCVHGYDNKVLISASTPLPELILIDLNTQTAKNIPLETPVHSIDTDGDWLYISTGGFIQIYKK